MLQKVQYLNIAVYIVVAFTITLIIAAIAVILNNKSKPSKAKLLSYETGCLPSTDAQNSYSIHFYVIGIIFLILDIEIILLFPWVLGIKQLGIFGFYKILTLWGILALGFIFEWSNNSLNWIK